MKFDMNGKYYLKTIEKGDVEDVIAENYSAYYKINYKWIIKFNISKNTKHYLYPHPLISSLHPFPYLHRIIFLITSCKEWMFQYLFNCKSVLGVWFQHSLDQWSEWIIISIFLINCPPILTPLATTYQSPIWTGFSTLSEWRMSECQQKDTHTQWKYISCR